MSLKQYRFADAIVFIFLAFATSFISEFFYRELPATLVYINFGLLVSLILFVRWGSIGALAYMFAGIPLLIYRSGDSSLFYQFLYYVLSNGSTVLLIFLFRFLKRQSIHQSIKWSSIYMLCAFFIIVFFKGIILSFSSIPLLSAWVSYFTAELFNFVMTWIAFVAINQFSEGLIIDMTFYIETIQGEKNHDAS